jgi:hypothetical protein
VQNRLCSFLLVDGYFQLINLVVLFVRKFWRIQTICYFNASLLGLFGQNSSLGRVSLGVSRKLSTFSMAYKWLRENFKEKGGFFSFLVLPGVFC